MRELPMLAAAPLRLRVEGLRVSLWAVAVGGLMLIALALRLFWVFYTDTIPLGGDPHWYYVVGINLAKGVGFVADRNEVWEIPGPAEPTAFWPPGYPFALGALFKVFGVSVTAPQVLNAVLGMLTIPLVFALGARCFNRGVGLAAAALFALFPNVIVSTPLLFPEPLFTLIFVGALLLLVSFPATGRWPPLVCFGFLVGLATLTRGQGLVLVPVAVVYWLMTAGWLTTARTTALALLTATAVITPWTARNAVEMHAFIPVSTNSAAALRVGHNEDSTGSTQWTDDKIDGFYMWQSLYRPDWEVKGYREYTRLAVDYAFTHPGDEVVLSGKKVYHLYRSDVDVIPWLETLGATPLKPEGLDGVLWRLLDTGYYTIVFAAVASVPLWLRRDPKQWLLVSLVLFWTLFHVAFLAEPRYHQPLYPIFFMSLAAGVWVAGASLVRAFERLRAHRAESATTTTMAVEDAPAS